LHWGTQNLKQRLLEHNRGKVPNNSSNRPWRIETVIAFKSENKARTFKRYLKSVRDVNLPGVIFDFRNASSASSRNPDFGSERARSGDALREFSRYSRGSSNIGVFDGFLPVIGIARPEFGKSFWQSHLRARIRQNSRLLLILAGQSATLKSFRFADKL